MPDREDAPLLKRLWLMIAQVASKCERAVMSRAVSVLNVGGDHCICRAKTLLFSAEAVSGDRIKNRKGRC